MFHYFHCIYSAELVRKDAHEFHCVPEALLGQYKKEIESSTSKVTLIARFVEKKRQGIWQAPSRFHEREFESLLFEYAHLHDRRFILAAAPTSTVVLWPEVLNKFSSIWARQKPDAPINPNALRRLSPILLGPKSTDHYLMPVHIKQYPVDFV